MNVLYKLHILLQHQGITHTEIKLVRSESESECEHDRIMMKVWQELEWERVRKHNMTCYSEMKLPILKVLGKTRGIKYYAHMNKTELCNILIKNDENPDYIQQ